MRTMKIETWCAVAGLLSSGISGTTAADVILTWQERGLFVEVVNCSPRGSCTGKGTGAYSDTPGPFTAFAEVEFGGGYGAAWIDSSVETNRIAGSGWADAEVTIDSCEIPPVVRIASSFSDMGVLFHVSDWTPISLIGSVGGTSSGSTSAISLRTEDGNEIATFAPSSMPIVGFEFTTMLPAGSYFFLAETGVGQFDGVSGRGGYDVALEFAPRPARQTKAPVALVGQSRSIEWSETVCAQVPDCTTDSGDASAPDFDPFTATVGSAAQSSTLTAAPGLQETTRIEASGAATPTVSADGAAGELNSETAASDFSVTFEVTEPRSVVIRAALLGGAILDFAPLGPPIEGTVFTPVEATLQLQAGTYTVTASASASVTTAECLDENSESQAFWLAIEFGVIIGDLTGDGVVDADDLGLLLAAWGSSGPGDLDGDGVVDGADLGLLLVAWSGE